MPASLTLIAPHTDAPDLLRVVVVHERRWVRAGLRALLERDPGIVVVAEASGTDQVSALSRALAPDVLLFGSPALAVEPPRGVAALVLDDEHPAAVVEAVKRAARCRTPRLKLIQGGSPWNSVI